MSRLRGRDGRTGGRADRRTVGPFAWALTLLALTVAPAAGQSLEQRIRAVEDGQVRFSYAAREGVCGNGRNIMTSRRSSYWEPDCEAGPVRVVLTMRDGRLTDVDTWVGGRWRAVEGVTDLGTVPAPDAARTLLALAGSGHRGGKDAILPATLADGITVWPDLIRLARDQDVPREVRKAAVFWLGQAAGEAAADDLVTLVDNPEREVQESAVFALSQLRDDGGVEPLIRIARTHDDPEIRKKAMFWLGQTGDPRVIALFEEILLRR